MYIMKYIRLYTILILFEMLTSTFVLVYIYSCLPNMSSSLCTNKGQTIQTVRVMCEYKI